MSQHGYGSVILYDGQLHCRLRAAEDSQLSRQSNCIHGEDFLAAKWSDPDVTDNSDKAISVTLTVPNPDTALAVGSHRVTYNARDSAGNMAYPCSFTVNVRRTS